ncbi:Plasmodium exported protein, unknown function [Plasmodium knowlesi strain H]|uniref:Uncharacterized protein n=3 Tax=Plasmodium knowlesi TaxID=5850 RepID=A0A5K1U4D2_PLAKH|nr:uncharacterized protein PKNH_0734900 [Plasmodium knowlesi strain H]OTN67354.1 Uncharacterized protein PKNOH_S06437000 [Plasmodium knowlesi]CAA9987640.1 Plasmodium exported protein, unknown function [Plasmodium knowlesi strain H]SBO26956.1 Plasmodium exported protein, unknown function [Plasmodium knowlesi strain H]SBO29277.1 Plasmodium exported protein, unknown function [Plasmodium knowlesi strain H]VVS77114.1 Plasmodium exported protein, unknown function [Plasmodium knowlesi strain H]|eukprot:XP_002258639.1 [Plasmodium knowlesi strain H]
MAVPTKQNKKARKAGAFPFCSKVSLYTLLIWIVNCSNSCQYDGNSYSVMNNSLGKAFDSRTLRLLAEAVESEDEIEQDGPVVYEDEIEQDGPVVYEEDIEQDGPVVHEEDIEQDGPVVHEEDIEQDGPVVHEEDIEQDGPVVHEEVAQQVPQHSGKKGKKEHKDGKSTSVGLRGANKENETDSYDKGEFCLREHCEKKITADLEEALKRCAVQEAQEDMDGQLSAGMPKLGGDGDPYGLLKKEKKGGAQEGYKKMLESNFSNIPYVDDSQNAHKSNKTHLEREYGRVDLTPPTKTTKNVTKNAETKVDKEKVEEGNGKEKVKEGMKEKEGKKEKEKEKKKKKKLLFCF